MISCDGDRRVHGLFKSVTIGPTHPIRTTGVVSPVSQRIGFPVIIHRHLPNGGYGAEHDCQIATYLMIDPVSGYAPFEYVQTFVTQYGIMTTPYALTDVCFTILYVWVDGSLR